MNAAETKNSGISDIVADDSIAPPKQTWARSGKRNLTLVMLALTAVTAAGALVAKRGPQAAIASPGVVASHESRSHDLAANSSDRPIEVTNDIVARLRFAPADVQVPLADLKSDPFRASPTNGQPLQLPDDAAETQRHEQERQAALEAVQTLRLQGIQRDETNRTCTINGALYQEGQEVDGFTVEEIATTTVVVRKNVYRFELRVR